MSYYVTGGWAAKIVKLKKIIFDFFGGGRVWTENHCHGNTAGNKPALNSGFDLFSEDPFIRFFHHLSLEN